MPEIKEMGGLVGSCQKMAKMGGRRVMRRANTSWQRSAEMREGDGKPQAAMICQVMAKMRGFERVVASCR